jgi:hypothetical protein
LLAEEDIAQFHTRSGLLTAEHRSEEIELNFPATPPTEASVPVGLVEALGVVPRYVGKSRYDYVVRGSGTGFEAGLCEAQGNISSWGHGHECCFIWKVRFRVTILCARDGS